MLGMNDVKQLLSQTDERTLTMFVDVDNETRENEATTPAWQIWIKNQLDDYARSLEPGQREAWPYIRDWVQNFIRSYTPGNKTLAIIAGPSYQTTFELPIKVDENQVWFGRPQIGHLLWMIDEYEPYLIVMVDQEKARFFTTYLGSVGFQGGMEIDTAEYDFRERTTMHAPGPGIDNAAVHGGTGVDQFENMLDEHRARFYRDVVSEIEKHLKRHETERIIIAGSEQAAHALQNMLDDRLKAMVVGIVSVPMHESAEQILERVQPLALEYERRQELDLVSQVIDFAKSRGRGALGRKDVQEALDMQRVDKLILMWPFADETADNELAFRALQLNSDIELVYGDAAALLHQEGDVAARLYYAL